MSPTPEPANAQQRLEEAIDCGDVEALAEALKAGADVNGADRYGFPPIVSAAHNGRLELVLALIEARADLGARVGGKQDTALHRAARFGRFCKRDGRDLSDSERECYLPMVKALLAAGSDLSLESEGRTPLALAIEFASAAVVQALVDAGADATIDAPIVNALRSRREPMVKIDVLLNAGAAVDAESGAPLAVAAYEFYDDKAVEACAMLLGAGAPIDQVTEGGWSALTHAVAGENLPLVELLLARGARADLPIVHDERQADLSPGITAARIATHWDLDDILAAIDKAGKSAPTDLPLERERLAGRWHLVAVNMDHEGDMYVLPKEDWADLGAQSGFLHLHPEGRLEGHDMSEIQGEWSLEDSALILANELADPESVNVSMEYGNRQILIAYDDDFGQREFWFEHD